jgi:hypothetical protein
MTAHCELSAGRAELGARLIPTGQVASPMFFPKTNVKQDPVRRWHRRRFFPGWDAALMDLPTEVLTSEPLSRQVDGLWLRQPDQFLHDALPRAQAFLDRFGDLRIRLSASASCTSPGAE